LPRSFKFEGQVIFISNKRMDQVDQAVRDRCAKVDVSMSPLQRIERMEHVLKDVMPHVSLHRRKEALELLRDNCEVARDISFRSLMNTITIRNEPGLKDWRELALFSLLEN
jgi:hypothetical protein